MFMRVWRFRAAAGKETEFERFNGTNGEWARLFAQAPGYLATRLTPIKGAPGEYRIVDSWDSREAWEAFRRDYSDAYERLDLEAASLTTSETLESEEDFLRSGSRWQLIVFGVGSALLYLEMTRHTSPEAGALKRIALSLVFGGGITIMAYVMERFMMPAMLRFTVKLWRRQQKAAGDRSPAAH